MENYIAKKDFIEGPLKASIMGAAAEHNAAVDATADLNSKARSERLHELVDRHKRTTEAARDAAVYKERDMVDALARDVEKALTQPPSEEALRFLDALALNPSVSQADIDAAAVSLEGSAVAESTLNGIAAKHGLLLPFEPVPSIATVRGELEAYLEQRMRTIRGLGANLGSDWKVDTFSIECFSTGRGIGAFDRAADIVMRYGD